MIAWKGDGNETMTFKLPILIRRAMKKGNPLTETSDG